MSGQVLALAGGVGGARLAHGFEMIASRALTVAVNTADDFEHLGLSISPDLDTVVYTLSGLADRQRGWGVAEESWTCLAQLGRLGGPDWFRLGDRDLATHLLRNQHLRAGGTLGSFTEDFAKRLGIGACIVPMSDDPVRTIVETPEGDLAFQDYFVRRQCAVPVTGFRFDGAESATPGPGMLRALDAKDLAAIIVCPSNPFVSIAPILAIGGLRARIAATPVPKIVVSPIISGKAVKGPAAKMMQELCGESSVVTVARHYSGFAQGIVIDAADSATRPEIEALGLAVHVTNTLMNSDADRKRLAEDCLVFAATLGGAAW